MDAYLATKRTEFTQELSPFKVTPACMNKSYVPIVNRDGFAWEDSTKTWFRKIDPINIDTTSFFDFTANMLLENDAEGLSWDLVCLVTGS
jgi:hypothetical protein